MCCAICCCVLFHTRPITNYKLLNDAIHCTIGHVYHTTHSHIHTRTCTSNKSRLNCQTRLRPPTVAAGRPELHPDKPSFDPLRPFEQYIRSQFAALESSTGEQLRKDLPSLSTNFGNLALHSPAIVAAAAALTKSPSTSTAIPCAAAPDSGSIAENQVIMRQKQQQYLRSQPPQQAATAASSVQQPPPPLETNFDRTSNNQTSANNSRNNRRIGRHESRYTSGNDEHSYIWNLCLCLIRNW